MHGVIGNWGNLQVGQFQQQGLAQIGKPFNFRFKINTFFFLSLINILSEMRKNMHGQS